MGFSVGILSTSSQPHSNTLRFAKFLQKLLTERSLEQVSLVSFENYDIPWVGLGSIHPSRWTPFQQDLIQSWQESDLLYIVSPEYNWSFSPALINALDQLGSKEFAHLFDNKVFALAGVSAGRGGRQPALQLTTVLNKLISFLDGTSVIAPRIFESHETDQMLDAEGNFKGTPAYLKGVEAFLEYSLRIAQRWFR
ncbi:MAG: NAD(P)H-dependent oxidoreductase [Cytophagales bacterium]|nr:NAD(P)H-dependent oxidoreductase [Bernardetiaceae bacterium]MDW8211839.1 NAD(P)H-dependent oxidoreductase [Cytophagales bacterium]